MGGRNPRLLMDIHNVSEVNRPEIELVENCQVRQQVMYLMKSRETK